MELVSPSMLSPALLNSSPKIVVNVNGNEWLMKGLLTFEKLSELFLVNDIHSWVVYSQ
jgi:hypothetical protein